MGNQQVNQDSLFFVPGFEYYYVDTQGNIWSYARSEFPKKLKPHLHLGRSKKPYLRLRIGGKLQLAHRVACSAFQNLPLSKIVSVNHLDGDTLNNSYGNLEVSDHAGQVAHAVQTKLYCQGEAWYETRGLTRKS
jgi:hypothetical protein